MRSTRARRRGSYIGGASHHFYSLLQDLKLLQMPRELRKLQVNFMLVNLASFADAQKPLAWTSRKLGSRMHLEVR